MDVLLTTLAEFKQAEQGHAPAQYNLAERLWRGTGVLKDDVEAVKWYHMAAEQGHAKAQWSLGFAYYCGIGVPQDYVEGTKWFREVAAQGNADDKFWLGWIYHYGIFAPQDYAEALKWYHMAAEQGHIGARRDLDSWALWLVDQGLLATYAVMDYVNDPPPGFKLNR